MSKSRISAKRKKTKKNPNAVKAVLTAEAKELIKNGRANEIADSYGKVKRKYVKYIKIHK